MSETDQPAKTVTPIDFMDSAAFSKAKYRHDWLIRSILIRDQPGVIGGEVKTLKTSLAIDLALSLGSGTPFLGIFDVPQVRRVAVVSGESGGATIRETAQRICAAKGIRLRDCDVLWSMHLPRFGSPAGRKAFRAQLREQEVDVVILDPLYLLLEGFGSAASNLYEIGPVLRRIGQACIGAGATPLFVHHATKGASSKARTPRPLGLTGLAYSGITEYVRQWLLLSRSRPYVDGTGRHDLILAAGGSAGHSGCWDVTVDEGVLDDDLGGREWRVHVQQKLAKKKENDHDAND